MTYPFWSLAPLGYRTPVLCSCLPTGWHSEEANMPLKLLERAVAEDENRGGQLPMTVQKETFSRGWYKAGHWGGVHMLEGG